MAASTHADALFHDPDTMNRAVHKLVNDGIVPREAIRVERATTAGERVLTPVHERSSIAVGAVAGAAIGAVLTFALVLAASLWEPHPSWARLLLTLTAGGALGALVGVTGALLLDLVREPAPSSAGMYRDYLVRIDVDDERKLEPVRTALRRTGADLLVTA